MEAPAQPIEQRQAQAALHSAAFDGHTSEGRRAISHFARTGALLTPVLGGIRDKQKALELAVFTVDSSLLDRRLLSPWSEALYQASLEGEIAAAGVSLTQFDQLAAVIIANRDALDLSRSIAAR